MKYVKDKSSDIQLHPRYQDKTFDKEAYGVLCHEVAHHLLGHLGEIKIKQKNNIEKIVVKDRRYLDTRIHELEAELTAWIVFLKLGEEKNSTSYLAKWISDEDDFQKISMTEILKVTNKILSLK